jgi:hypothetical protein
MAANVDLRNLGTTAAYLQAENGNWQASAENVNMGHMTIDKETWDERRKFPYIGNTLTPWL